MKKITKILLIVGTIFIASCSKENPIVVVPDEPLVAKTDGVYVYGSNTIASKSNTPEAKMNLAKLDPGKGLEINNKDGVYGRYMYVGANSTINVSNIVDNNETVYGLAEGGSLVNGLDVGSAIDDEVIYGLLVEDGPAINITNEGLYHVLVNLIDKNMIITQVKPQIIGDATELQWSAGTPLNLKSISNEEAVFESENIVLFGATGYRYRLANGWHFYDDRDASGIITISSLGVESYGDSWAVNTDPEEDGSFSNPNLGFYLENIPHKIAGLFTITLTFNAATGEWTELKTKTGENFKDWSEDKFGFFGNGFYYDNNGESTQGSWTQPRLAIAPSQVPDTYTYRWEWDVEFIADRHFIIRNFVTDSEGVFDSAASNTWITWNGSGKTGDAFDDGDIVKEDGTENFQVVNSGSYKVVFEINAADNDGRTLTITKN
ncbi:MAG: hypothetical protein HWE24_13425 [Oceanospirillaceae bacterium]|nr:hypothetical protein [Oceanospirillaceae bacterium]